MLSAIDPDSSWASCITAATCSRNARAPTVGRGTPSTRTSPLVGSSRPTITLTSVVLPPPGWTHDRNEFSWLNSEIDIFQHEGLRFGIAEEHVTQLDASQNRPCIGQGLVVSPLTWRQRNVGESFEMKAQYAEVERLLHERDRLVDEVLPVSHERENHPDGQLVGKHQSCREIDDDDRFQAEDQIVDRAEGNLGSPQPDVRACDFGVTVQPLAFPLGLAIEELEALDCPHAFNEI